MSCPVFPVNNNNSLAEALNSTLYEAFNLSLPSYSDQNALDTMLSNLFCSADGQSCYGICPNADLAGIGVRVAFWLSSTLQAILVLISPEDSTQGAWTAVMLTMSIIIPAIRQKRQRALTVYHATLVLNFATFSSVVSLAVAPMCALWRQGLAQNDKSLAVFGEEAPEGIAHLSLSNLPRRKVHRQRLTLSSALLAQVSLQWTWAVMLFTDPEYAQTACSPSTRILLFGVPFSVQEINDKYFLVWIMWLLFNVSASAIWGVLLVVNSSPSVHPVLSRRPTRDSTWTERLPSDKGRLFILIMNCLAFLVALLFLVSSEIQANRIGNCIMGENSDWSFGQIAALLVALIPAWPICVAVNKYRQADVLPVSKPVDPSIDAPILPPLSIDLTPCEDLIFPSRVIVSNPALLGIPVQQLCVASGSTTSITDSEIEMTEST